MSTEFPGEKYFGDWKANKRHGKGVNTYINKNRYSGDWFDDKKDGNGIYFT